CLRCHADPPALPPFPTLRSSDLRTRRAATVTDRFAAVALPLPVAEPYRYRIPPALADRALPGARVVVPVRQQEMLGVVTATDVPDRKSTRLNSSHVKSSYAVFRL